MSEPSAPTEARKTELILGQALSHIRIAISLCDQLGASHPACHLQHGLDLLEASAAAPESSPVQARLH